MENIILIIVLLALVGGALWYIRREKRRGKQCIGCPYSGNCPSRSCGSRPEE